MKPIKQQNFGGCNAGITDGSDLWRTTFRWTQFHEEWLGHSGNVEVITSTIWEAAVLVLVVGRTYDVYRWDYLRWYDTYMPSFMTIGSEI
jgi:hypothetical protein